MKVYCSGVWGFFQMELFVKFVIQFIFAVFLQFVFFAIVWSKYELFIVYTRWIICEMRGRAKCFVIERFREIVKVACF